MLIGYNERRPCEVEGCRMFGRNKGFYKGKIRYDHVCDYHHRKGNQVEWVATRANIDNKKCDRCGWDKAPCDRHRVDPKKGYTKSNVVILCPNCHRLETLGL
jgi:5-methylcytosine-specific restriction endonuclease McrA